MSEPKRPWDETWTLYDHAHHVTESGEWLHIVKRADCPHETELHAKCDVVMFEKGMADGRCDDRGAYLERAKLAAAAPELYRALAKILSVDCSQGIPPVHVTIAAEALRKARGET